MNGRRIRGIKPSRVTKINRQIQLMNDQIANCHRILEEVEYTLQPGDYLGGRIEDHYNYSIFFFISNEWKISKLKTQISLKNIQNSHQQIETCILSGIWDGLVS